VILRGRGVFLGGKSADAEVEKEVSVRERGRGKVHDSEGKKGEALGLTEDAGKNRPQVKGTCRGIG